MPSVCRSDLLDDRRPAGPGARHRPGERGVATRRPRGHAVRSRAIPTRTPTITLARGPHVVRTSEGVRTGLQLDRLVLASGGGRRAARGRRRARDRARRPRRRPRRRSRSCTTATTRMRVHVTGADAPFWLVLGESQSPGWKATIVERATLGPSQLVDGYANGWLVQPAAVVVRRRARVDAAAPGVGRDLDLGARRARVPRRSSRSGRSSRRRATVAVAPNPADSDVWIEWPVAPRGERRAARAAAASSCRSSLGLVAALIVAPWVGVLVAALVVAIQWRPRLRAILVLAPAGAARAGDASTSCICSTTSGSRRCSSGRRSSRSPGPLAWLAVVFLGVDVVVEQVRSGGPQPCTSVVRQIDPDA